MRRFVILFLSVVSVSSVPVDLKRKNGGKNFQPVPINPVNNASQNGISNGGNVAQLNGQLFKTVKRYQCILSQNEDQANVMLYGSNGWAFPEQDVNLTLSYPTDNALQHDTQDFDDYVIIGYEIILFTDGSDSAGFITAGGILQQNITLNFIISNITMFSYEFWLFGVPASQATTYNVNYQMC